MPAQIKFYGGDNGTLDIDSGGSGIGFFGSSFGQSVAVGSYQDTTWVTDGNGSVQGAILSNWKFINNRSGVYGGDSSTYALSGIPNNLATLNVRFTNDSAVKCQNVRMRIYDRANLNRAPSGVTTQVAELCRPNNIFGNSFANPTLGPWGSGSASWITANPTGSSTIITAITQSPGISGLNVRSTTATDTRHDWYFLLSASPTSIGSKIDYGLYFSLEYL